MVDNSAAVVERRNSDSLGQAGLQVRDLLFDGVDDFESICAGTNYDHSADRFLSITIEHAPPEVGSEMYVGYIAQIDGGAIASREHNVFDVGDRTDQADAAHRHFGIVDLHHLRAHVGIAALNGLKHCAQRDVISAQIGRAHV